MLEDYAIKTGQVLCLDEFEGDVNDDCKVDLIDLSGIAGQWLDSTNPGTTPKTRVVSWKFDETTGLTATDSSGNGIDGTLGVGFADEGDAQWVIDGGRTGASGDNALYINGSGVVGDPNNAIIATVASPASLPNGAGNIFEGTASWTMNLWIKYDGTPSASVNIGGFGQNEWLDPSTNSDRYFASYGGYAGYELELGQDGVWPSDTITGDWQMLTATYDGTTCKMYYNGVQVAQSTVALVDTLVNEINLSTARRVLWDSGAIPIKGTIDDFSIWSEAFNAAQVLGMYTNSFPSCDGTLAADLNGNCEVGLDDLLIVAGDWLECLRVPSSLCN
jgi:alpha-mannosidase